MRKRASIKEESMPRSAKDASFQARQMPAAYAKFAEVFLKRCAGAVEEYVAALSKATSAFPGRVRPGEQR